jgi:hypothetical protein
VGFFLQVRLFLQKRTFSVGIIQADAETEKQHAYNDSAYLPRRFWGRYRRVLNAVMLAVILVLVVGTIRLIGSNAGNTFSNVASSLS